MSAIWLSDKNIGEDSVQGYYKLIQKGGMAVGGEWLQGFKQHG